jgi:hypothetical protein
LTTWSIFAVARFLWVIYGLLNRKPAIYVGTFIGLVMNLLMVERHPDALGWTHRVPRLSHRCPRSGVRDSIAARRAA